MGMLYPNPKFVWGRWRVIKIKLAPENSVYKGVLFMKTSIMSRQKQNQRQRRKMQELG